MFILFLKVHTEVHKHLNIDLITECVIAFYGKIDNSIVPHIYLCTHGVL